jgi:hypothetical protein
MAAILKASSMCRRVTSHQFPVPSARYLNVKTYLLGVVRVLFIA